MSTVIKKVWFWQKDKHLDTWDRIENPEKDPNKYPQLIFDKGLKQSDRGFFTQNPIHEYSQMLYYNSQIL